MTDTNSGKRRTDAEQQQLVAAITDMFEKHITFNGFLGFKIGLLDTEKVVIKLPMRKELIGHYLHGRLHGGVISSVLDSAGGLAVMWKLAEFYPDESAMQIMERFRYLGTIDLRIDYLRQGIGEVFFAEAEVVRLGRRIAVIRMRLLNEKDVLIATGNGNYIVS